MLELKNLTKRYKDFTALNAIDFTISAGERVALLGTNGSGKTTIVRSICRLLEWEQGDILFCGQSIKNRRQYLGEIGAVLEGSRDLNWRLSAAQNARYYAGIRGVSARDVTPVINRMMNRLGLDKYGDRMVGKLSTGNRQKSALLSALVHKPKLLLLDEPTLGLDIETVDELEEVLLELSEKNNQGMLITSHDMEFIGNICERVILIDKGSIIFDGNMASLHKKLFHYEMIVRLPAHLLLRIVEEGSRFWSEGRINCFASKDEYIIQYDKPAQLFSVIQWLKENGADPDDMTISKLSLEKAYKAMLEPKEE